MHDEPATERENEAGRDEVEEGGEKKWTIFFYNLFLFQP
jgi:hypothetical protein